MVVANVGLLLQFNYLLAQWRSWQTDNYQKIALKIIWVVHSNQQALS